MLQSVDGCLAAAAAIARAFARSEHRLSEQQVRPMSITPPTADGIPMARAFSPEVIPVPSDDDGDTVVGAEVLVSGGAAVVVGACVGIGVRGTMKLTLIVSIGR